MHLLLAKNKPASNFIITMAVSCRLQAMLLIYSSFHSSAKVPISSPISVQKFETLWFGVCVCMCVCVKLADACIDFTGVLCSLFVKYIYFCTC